MVAIVFNKGDTGFDSSVKPIQASSEMLSITLIHGYKTINANAIINEVGTEADVLAVVKQNAAKVIKFTPAPKAEYQLAA